MDFENLHSQWKDTGSKAGVLYALVERFREQYYFRDEGVASHAEYLFQFDKDVELSEVDALELSRTVSDVNIQLLSNSLRANIDRYFGILLKGVHTKRTEHDFATFALPAMREAGVSNLDHFAKALRKTFEENVVMNDLHIGFAENDIESLMQRIGTLGGDVDEFVAYRAEKEDLITKMPIAIDRDAQLAAMYEMYGTNIDAEFDCANIEMEMIMFELSVFYMFRESEFFRVVFTEGDTPIEFTRRMFERIDDNFVNLTSRLNGARAEILSAIDKRKKDAVHVYGSVDL